MWVLVALPRLGQIYYDFDDSRTLQCTPILTCYMINCFWSFPHLFFHNAIALPVLKFIFKHRELINTLLAPNWQHDQNKKASWISNLAVWYLVPTKVTDVGLQQPVHVHYILYSVYMYMYSSWAAGTKIPHISFFLKLKYRNIPAKKIHGGGGRIRPGNTINSPRNRLKIRFRGRHQKVKWSQIAPVTITSGRALSSSFVFIVCISWSTRWISV